MADEVVIVGSDGTEHIFPAGFDPKQASAIVRSKDPALTRQAIAAQFAARPIADIGAGAANLGARSDPGDVLSGALSAINPLEWLRGVAGAGHLLLHPSEIPDAAHQAMTGMAEHPGAAAGAGLVGAALPPALDLAGSGLNRVRAATAPFAETLLSKKLGLDPDAIDLQATRLRLQAARSRTRQATRAAASESPATPASSAPASAAPEIPVAAPSAPAPPAGPAAALSPKAAQIAQKLKLTPEEYRAFQGLVQQGRDPGQVLKAIEGQRAALALQQRFQLPTNADVDAAVADRNATGRWPQDRP